MGHISAETAQGKKKKSDTGAIKNGRKRAVPLLDCPPRKEKEWPSSPVPREAKKKEHRDLLCAPVAQKKKSALSRETVHP